MIERPEPIAFRERVLVLVLTAAMAAAAVSTAYAQRAPWRDDQIRFGPAGTIGRGTDGAGDPPYGIQGGLFVFGISRGRPVHVPRAWGPPPAPGYRTDQYFQPGDGYRYPLYFNPATGTYRLSDNLFLCFSVLERHGLP
jgi:hypothetical protein